MRQILRLKHSPYHLSVYFFLFLLGLSSTAFSQGNDSKGKDFWLMFNSNISTPVLTVFITSDVNTSGTVAVPGLGFTANFNVTANTVTPVIIPVATATHTNNVIDNKGVHITAQQEVTVYGLNYAPFTTDAYLGLPTDVLGTEYIVLTYSGQNRSQLGVVATENATTVTITPSVSAGGRPAGVPFNIVMNQGQTYELGFATDLTGTIITSTKPIGVMGSNACANIPPNAAFCDHIVEMIPPVTTWGRKFA
ncbi:MAG: IgGFc-binding protein, partial [Flavitalea sp.]